ncbi:MAG: trimeric intracellular cation channel family protein, partial [Thiomicrorhabdus sp.]|nr:trimeric intracellular cation channel family protein [Thiomicrorhabdus sp.]
LVGEVPLIFRKEIYATASFIGASVMVLATGFFEQQEVAVMLCIVVVFSLRILTIIGNYSLPVFNPIHKQDSDD